MLKIEKYKLVWIYMFLWFSFRKIRTILPNHQKPVNLMVTEAHILSIRWQVAPWLKEKHFYGDQLSEYQD